MEFLLTLIVLSLILFSFSLRIYARIFVVFITFSLFVLLSFRSAPDEYLRYINEHALRSFHEIFDIGLLGEPIFKLMATLSFYSISPLSFLYMLTYLLTLIFLFSSFRGLRATYFDSALLFSFYLAYPFLSLGFIAIRGALANSIVLYAAILLISHGQRLRSILLCILAMLIHLQSIPFIFSLFATYMLNSRYISKLNSKIPYVFATILIAMPILSYLFCQYLFTSLVNTSLDSADMLPSKYSDYATSDSYGYALSNTSFALYLPIVLFVGIAVFTYLFRLRSRSTLAPYMVLLSFGLCIFYASSSIAIFSYRFFSPFILIFLPIMAFALQPRYPLANSTLNRIMFRSYIAGLSLLVLILNLSLGRFSGIQFT